MEKNTEAYKGQRRMFFTLNWGRAKIRGVGGDGLPVQLTGLEILEDRQWGSSALLGVRGAVVPLAGLYTVRTGTSSELHERTISHHLDTLAIAIPNMKDKRRGAIYIYQVATVPKVNSSEVKLQFRQAKVITFSLSDSSRIALMHTSIDPMSNDFAEMVNEYRMYLPGLEVMSTSEQAAALIAMQEVILFSNP